MANVKRVCKKLQENLNFEEFEFTHQRSATEKKMKRCQLSFKIKIINPKSKKKKKNN
jgi:hypothetical protein